jgi:hypothetical protein
MTDALALYGAIIGTAAALGALWNIYSGMRDRARLKVMVRRELVGWAPHTVECLGIEVSNVGRRPVTVQSYKFQGNDGRGLIPPMLVDERYGPIAQLLRQTITTPKRLNEGEQHTFRWPLQVVIDSIAASPTFRVIGIEVTDGTGRTWSHRLSDGELRLLDVRRD